MAMLGAPINHYHPFSALENYKVSFPSVLNLQSPWELAVKDLAISQKQRGWGRTLVTSWNLEASEGRDQTVQGAGLRGWLWLFLGRLSQPLSPGRINEPRAFLSRLLVMGCEITGQKAVGRRTRSSEDENP